MKTVYIGKEGSGKSYLMGQDTLRVIERNQKWFKKTGVLRPVVSNMTYSAITHEHAHSKGIPIIYWRDIESLERLRDCDLFIDEVGAYFDSRTFADLPLTTRLWLAQAQKLGVDIYAGAQDWGQIDVSFRRLVSRLYELKKIVGSRRPSRTRPSGKLPWAIVLSWSVAPASSNDSAELKTLSIIPGIHFAGKKHFRRFNTNARILTSDAAPLQRIVRHWYDPETGKVGYTRTTYR